MKSALQPLPGVAEINVDFANRIVHIKTKAAAEEFSSDKAIAVLADAGYPATLAEQAK